jgi:hypothetical protein
MFVPSGMVGMVVDGESDLQVAIESLHLRSLRVVRVGGHVLYPPRKTSIVE